MSALLPTQALEKWGNLHGLAQRTRHEWSASCPQCGDTGHIGSDLPDRFRIFTNGKVRGWCRSCNHFEFADKASGIRLTPEQKQEIQLERVRLANVERKRVKKKIEKLEAAALWRGYHDGMAEAQRELWRVAGINDVMQDYWELGFNPELKFRFNDEERTSPALTIPYFHDDKCVNVQSRLLNPALAHDKYRFTYGLPAPTYIPERGQMPLNKTLVVEGAKKAMVSYLYLGQEYSVVGIPSKTLTQHQLESLKDSDPVILCLDPDANEDGTTLRNARKIGTDRTRIAVLPGKIDDLLVQFQASHKDILAFIDKARPA